MTAPTPQIETLATAAGEPLWQTVLARFAAELQDRTWDPPLWILPDARHREAAELGLLQQLRHQGIPLSCVGTLATTAAELLNEPAQLASATPAYLALLIAEILGSDPPVEYQLSAQSPGFAATYCRALMEVEGRGFFPTGALPQAEGAAPSPAFRELQSRLHHRLEQHRRCTPGEFLRRALADLRNPTCQYSPPTPLFIGPCAAWSTLEREFIRALMDRAERVVLSETPHRLSGLQRREPIKAPLRLAKEVYWLRPRTPEAELEAACALSAQWAAEGRFRYGDIRIVHPQMAELLPRLRSAARRYRIPLRTNQPQMLAEAPIVIQLSKLLELFVSGWQREPFLQLLRSQLLTAPIEEKHRLITAVLEQAAPHSHKRLTEYWLGLAQTAKTETLSAELQKLKTLDDAGSRIKSPREFASWLADGFHWVQSQWNTTNVGFTFIGADKIEAGVTEAWSSLLTALALRQTPFAQRSIGIEELKRALRLTAFIPAKAELDSVELISAQHEDHLPCGVLIYLGLNSRFPALGRNNPFGDSDALENYAEKERLFHSQLINAQQLVLLSCPQYDDDGDELATSPFLKPLEKLAREFPDLASAETWRPALTLKFADQQPTADPVKAQKPTIQRSRALLKTREISQTWSPTRLEQALQCPYLHFARHVLKLTPLADTVSLGLTPLILGQIAHRVLEDYLKSEDSTTFDLDVRISEELQRRERFFDPHLEADRAVAELRRCLRQFVELGWRQLHPDFSKYKLELKLGDRGDHPGIPVLWADGQAILEGQMDRLDKSPDNRVFIIDYKYKKSDNLKSEFFAETATGFQPQLPLYYYMILQSGLRLRPVALLEIYLRSAELIGYRLSEAPEFSDFKQVRLLERMEIEEMANCAIERLGAEARRLATGSIPPEPRDYRRCGAGVCDFADLCRFRKSWR